ncbi:MAG: hypothetical protein AB7T74_01545 [Clostridia bacterium]
MVPGAFAATPEVFIGVPEALLALDCCVDRAVDWAVDWGVDWDANGGAGSWLGMEFLPVLVALPLPQAERVKIRIIMSGRILRIGTSQYRLQSGLLAIRWLPALIRAWLPVYLADTVKMATLIATAHPSLWYDRVDAFSVHV